MKMTIIAVIVLGINFIGNGLLIGHYGISGVIVSTIVASVFYFIASVYLIQYRLKLPILDRTFLQIPVAALVFLVSLYNASLVSVCMQGFVYVGIFILFKNEDVISLFIMVKKRYRLLRQ